MMRREVTVNLSWPASPEKDLAGYRVMLAGDGSWSQSSVTVEKDTTAFVISVELAPGVYKFWVSAFDVAGNESAKKLIQTVYVAA